MQKRYFSNLVKFSLSLMLFLTLVLNFIIPAQKARAVGMDYSAWNDVGIIYTAPSGSAYYPSVLYKANGFGSGTPLYKMWYSDGNGQAFVIDSSDGFTWGTPTTLTGLGGDAHHVQVLYDAACFGTLPCDGSASKYKIWYFDTNANLYSITAMATAQSTDGVNWTGDSSLTQSATAQLVTGAGTGWNRGSYGPISLFYQPDASDTGTDPWNYSYVMDYDGTDGSSEVTGLAYSTDGLFWSAYSASPVLDKSAGNAWDCDDAAYGTVFHDAAGYHYWYSGGGGDNGSGTCRVGAPVQEGIGYASSPDGFTWTKKAQPIFHISQGVGYRNLRVYTPAVVDDGSGTLKMYYSALSSTSGDPKKIGLAILSPASVYVDDDWIGYSAGTQVMVGGMAHFIGADAFDTVQKGVNSVASGGTVNVAAGTYDEQVVIDKALTLQGVGDTTVIQPSQATASSFTLYDRRSGGPVTSAGILVTDTTSTVNVRDLKIDGSLVTSTPGADGFMGILYRGTPGLVDSVIVNGISITNGVGMYLSGYGSPVAVSASNSTISSYLKAGIVANNAGITAAITGNTITGMGPTIIIAQNGIQFGYGATGTISENTISGHVWTGTYGGSNDPAADAEADGASGILLYMPGAGIEIDHNVLTANQFGLWSVAAPDVNVHDNTITGLAHTGSAYPVAIAVWSEDMWTDDMGGTEQATDATISNNTISTNDYGLLVLDYTAGGPVPTASVNGNTFNENLIQATATGSSVFNVSATLAANTFDKTVTVNHLGSLRSTIWGTVQGGVDGAAAGDAVVVSPGIYRENVVVNKSVAVAGSGAASTIVQPAISNPNCGGAGGGSLCPGGSYVFLVEADNVIIHDLAVDGDNPTLTSGVVVGGADLDARNGIITNHSKSVYNGLEVYNVTIRNIFLRGLYASSNGTFNFHNNTVTNVRADSSSIAIFAWVGSGTIANNTVSYANDAISANHSSGIQFLSNTVTHSASGIHTDNAGDGGGVADLIQGNTITDCTTDGYGIFTFVPYIAPVVNNNTVTNCAVGLSAWGQGAAVTPQFTNNVVTGPAKAAGSVGAYITTDQIGYGYNDISVLFTGNTITNFETGVYLTADEQTWTSGWVSKTITATFHSNQISGNTHGLDIGTTGDYVTDFEKNWWGAVSGPGPVALGSGDTIVAGVDYSPWCTNPACTTFAPPFATVTAITSDTPDPSVVGQAVTVTATVTGLPSGALTPTGAVLISDGTPSGTSCTITLVNGTGSCDLTFTSIGSKTLDALFTPASTADFSSSSDTEPHTVTKASPSVTTWPTASSINYGQALSASTLSGGVATPSGTFAFTSPATRPNAGTTQQSVTFTPDDTVNYSPVTGTVSVLVNKAPLSITANNDTRTFTGGAYGGGNGVTCSGFVNNETSVVLGGTLTFGGTSQGAVNVGSYSIVPGGLTSENYTITFHEGTLTIQKAAQTITFGPLADRQLDDPDFVVTATASSGLDVAFTTVTPGVCTITSTGLVHLVSSGTCTLQADQSGNPNFNSASHVRQSFAVGQPEFILYLPLIFR
jgi:hypothetical protein